MPAPLLPDAPPPRPPEGVLQTAQPACPPSLGMSLSRIDDGSALGHGVACSWLTRHQYTAMVGIQCRMGTATASGGNSVMVTYQDAGWACPASPVHCTMWLTYCNPAC